MSRALTVAAAASLLVASCGPEPLTAVVVEFLVEGDRSDEARWLEVGLLCRDDLESYERRSFDLDLLGEGEEATLALEPRGDDPCPVILLAQLRTAEGGGDGEPAWVLASAREQILFQPGEVTRETVVLDTSACADADADGAAAGLGDCGASRDCDDLDPTVREGGIESCDGVDQDCNGVVDDLSEASLAEACPAIPGERPPWQPGEGLCTYWAPFCNGREVVCPDLDLVDDCDLRFDTNCDGRVSCGCDPETVAVELGCEPCHEAVCDGDDAICRPVGLEAGLPGDACLIEDGSPCPGRIGCDPRQGRLACLPAPEGTPELCNAEGTGLDEDCDGRIDWDDPDCAPLAETGGDCSAYAFARLGNDASPSPADCDGFDGFEANCSGGGTPLSLPGDLTIVVDLHPEVVPDVGTAWLSCCACSVHSVAKPRMLGGLTMVSIDVDRNEGGPALFVRDDVLILRIDAAYAPGGEPRAVARGLEVTVPVQAATGVIDPGFGLGTCLSDCTDGGNVFDLFGLGSLPGG